jgi:hypothetical protein
MPPDAIRETVSGMKPSRATVALALAVAAVLSGCGGSSKPAFCSSLNDLKTSVTDLKNVDVIKNGTSSVTAALQKVQSNAKSVVSSAKSDFPTQTQAISSAVTTLETTIGELKSSPTQPSLIAALPGQVSALANSVKTFESDASSKCS